MKAEVTTTRKRGWRLPLAGVLLLGLLVAGSVTLGFDRHRAEAKESERLAGELAQGPVVQTALAKLSPPERQLTLTGEVRAFREATLYAKVSGYLKLVRVDKGDHVGENEVLGVIEAPEVEQEVASKRADVAIKKLTDARVQSLIGTGVVSQQESDRARSDVQIATADLARLESVRGYQVIRAPFAGTITARYADPGALLQAATSTQSALPLARISDLDHVRIFVYLAQADALLVHVGDPVTLWSEERGPRIEAKITRFENELDTRTRTMLTEVDIDNREANFYPGAFVRVKLKIADVPMVSIPADSVMYESGKTVVAVLRDGHAHFAPVDIASTDGVVARVRTGISDGDHVILHPGDDVADGGAVREAPPPAQKAP